MKRYGWATLAAYVAVIFLANWAIERYGFVPVGFGLIAPAGVFFAGLAFEFRDLTQDALGRRWVVAAILVGALLSYFISARFALASGVAFLAGELADFALYTPLRKRYWLVAMLVANTLGDVVDSLLFLWLAFGSVQFWQGQVVGKAYMTLIAVAILWLARAGWRVRRARLAVA
jgi:hypothetical protein